MSGWMDVFLKTAVDFSIARYAIRTLIVIVWLVAGWRIVHQCFKKASVPSKIVMPWEKLGGGTENFPWE
jgi:hypothetical protein